MSLERRDLESGTRLVGRYKGQTFRAEVVETEAGTRYRLEDGREYKSPSSAGSAVMGGRACNGWQFWSLAEEVAEKVKAPKRERKGREKPRVEKAAQEGVQCGECGKSFPSITEAAVHMAAAHGKDKETK